MALFDELELRERDVLDQLEELDRKRDPLLSYLADIRVAKAALRPSVAPLLKLAHTPDDASAQFYQSLTLKQLTLRALRDRFLDSGASAQQLLEFFENGYGRQIERSSLSPQLSRLKEDGEVELDGKLWRLPREEIEKARMRASVNGIRERMTASLSKLKFESSGEDDGGLL